MSEKEFEKVNIPSADTADKEPESEKLNEKHAEQVVGGGYEAPSVQGAGDGDGADGLVFVPVLAMANSNVVSNSVINTNTAVNHNINVASNTNTNIVVNTNVNSSTNINTFDEGY